MRARTGTFHLPPHGGRTPAWRFGRMVRLARAFTIHGTAEYGAEKKAGIHRPGRGRRRMASADPDETGHA